MASTALVVNAWPDGTTREGRGGGLFYAAPLFLRGLSIGAGVQWLRPSLASRAQRLRQARRWPGGLRLGREPAASA